MVGRTYQFSFADATIEEPPGVGGLLGGYIEQDLLVEVTDVADPLIDFMGGLSEAGSSPPEQDLCAATADLADGDLSANPYFVVGPTELTMEASGVAITLFELEVSGVFVDDGDAIEDGEITGLIDTRPLDSLVGGGEGAVCDLVGSFGASCEDCPDGDTFCLRMKAVDIEAPWIEGLDLEESEGCE